jgi:hypothetical protein
MKPFSTMRPIGVHKRAQSRRGLDDGGDGRRFLQRQLLRGFVEVRARRRFHAVQPRAEVDLVGVHRQDFALGVALFNLDGDQNLLGLALEAFQSAALKDAVLHVLSQEQCPRELLRNRAGAVALPGQDVPDRRHDHPRDADAEVALEPGIFGGDDRLPQHRCHVVVADDHATLDREFADLLAVAGEQARDGVRAVVVEGADLRQVAGVREQHAAQGSQRGGDQEEENEDSLKADPQHEPRALTARRRFWRRRLLW